MFHDCVFDVLYSIIGDRGMKVVLFHIQLGNYLDCPERLHRDLLTIFGTGAKSIEKLIVKELFWRLNLPFEEKESFDFVEYVEHARELYMARMKENSPRQAFDVAKK